MSRHPGEPVKDQVRRRVWGQAQCQSQHPVRDQVWVQVHERVDDQAWRQAVAQLREEPRHDQTSR